MGVAVLVGLCSGCTFRIIGLPINGGTGDDLSTKRDDLATPTVGDMATGATGDLAAGADMAGCSHVLCEDWETGALLPRWTKHQVLGTVAVDGTRPHRGSYSLHSHANASTPNNSISAFVSESVTFPQLHGGLFVRAFVYVPSPLPAATEELWEMNSSGSYGEQLAIDSNNLMLFYQYSSNPDVGRSSAASIPTDRWVCVEWMMLNGETRTWFDGVELTEMHVTGLKTWTYDTLQIGTSIFRTANEPAYDLWIDDVMVDASGPIGCN